MRNMLYASGFAAIDPHDAQLGRCIVLLPQAEYPSPDTRQCRALQPAAVCTVQARAAA